MAKIRVLNSRELDLQIQNAIKSKMEGVFTKAQSLLIEQAKVYRDAFANSAEFNNMKTKLVGEFGFTPDELAGLDKVLDLLMPQNEVTTSFLDTVGSTKFLILEWVDYQKLKTHPLVQHPLTKLDKFGKVVSVTDVISWVEWLEEGVTVAGYSFFRPNNKNIDRSRSKQGLMRKSNGFFVIDPTRIFEKIGNEANNKVLRRGFGALVRKVGRQ